MDVSNGIALITRGPNVVHPEIPSAVGSRNSMNRNERDEYVESHLVVDEEVDKILNHIHSKLPPEVVNRLEVMGSIKSKLHDYYNQGFQNMVNRYITTVEDELGKKVRDLVDMEELRGLNRYTPRQISYLLDRIGGADRFNTSELEKSVVNMFGHLQGHVQREMNDLETRTNSLLRRKTDVGAFIRGENSYAIVACSFKDHPLKPNTVFKLKLSMNVIESELISRIYPYHTTSVQLLKEVMTVRAFSAIDKELDRVNEELLDAGRSEMNDEEKIFERMKILENYISDEDSEDSARYMFLAKRFLDGLDELGAELEMKSLDALNLGANIVKVVQKEDLRNRGWNTAVNSLTHVLDWSRMGYQHMENLRAQRKLVIREYQNNNENKLPDEHYKLDLKYLDSKELRLMREAYDLQLQEFDRTIKELTDVIEAIKQEHLKNTDSEDWNGLYQRLTIPKPDDPKRWSWFSFGNRDADEEDEDEIEVTQEEPKERKWNEIVFVAGGEEGPAGEHPTMETKIEEIKERFRILSRVLQSVFQKSNPTIRLVVEERLRFLKDEFNVFSSQINPYHINPGIFLDVDISSVKRKSTTMMNMANVLNEFLYSISSGFADQAFASFSRRRSTERDDLEGEFVSMGTKSGGDEESDDA